MKTTVDRPSEKLSEDSSEKLSEGPSEKLSEGSSKSNKRAQALKGILEKQGIEAIPEDRIEGGNPTGTSRIATFGTDTKTAHKSASSAASLAQSTAQSTTQSTGLFNRLIDEELGRSAAGLGIDKGELKAWVDLQIEVPPKAILALLRSMQSLHLDPLCEEIGFTNLKMGSGRC